MFSHRLADALELAIDAHDGQVRKGTSIPYISHPLAVASLVLEYGGTEDQAIAGLLHDTIEDGGEAYAEPISIRFGSQVLALVRACTDGTAETKAAAVTPEDKLVDWKRRKTTYLKNIETMDPAAVLVAACDKLHNARSIVADLESIGPEVFDRFKSGREGTLWYYAAAEEILRERGCPVVDALQDALIRMRQLSRTGSDDELICGFAESLTPKQRVHFRKLMEKLHSDAQSILSHHSIALSAASNYQQALLMSCQQLDSADEEA